MSDHIIKAAKEAGGTTYTNRHYPGETACAFGPEALGRFYAIAYQQGLEDAAKVCEQKAAKLEHIDPPGLCANYFARGAESSSIRCANSIRALKEQQNG